MDNPFADLIPQKSANPFADLIPSKVEPSLSDAITDIPGEISNAASEAIANMKGVANRGQQGPIEGLINTGKAVMAVPQLMMSPITGAARSLIGHPMAQAEHAVGKLIAPEIASKDDLRKMYEASKGDVDLAMQALAAREIPTPAVPTLKPGQQAALAADRLSQTGSPVAVPRAVTTDSMPLQQVAATTSNVPVAGTPLVKGAENAIKQLGAKADEVAQGYGGGAPIAQSGDTARSSIKDWITGESAQTSTKLYSKVDALVNPDVKTPLDATRAVVADIATKRDAAALSSGKATDAVLQAVQRLDGLTYEGVKTLRTNIGEMLKGGILPEGVSGSELKNIYGGLSKDLETSVAAAGGPRASAAFDRANKYYRLASDRRESLAKIIGADGNAPAETVFGRIEAMAGSTSRADISKLAQARKAIGAGDWNELASTVVSRLGRDVEGHFTPQRFVTAYGKLSNAGKGILFRSTGKTDLASHLDDIAKVSSRFKELQKFANPSGTARAGLGGLIGAGAFTEPLTTLTTVLGGRAVATALARPASAASIAKISKSQQALVTSPTPSKVAAYSLAARNLISTLGAKNVTTADFLRALQGPVPARTEDKQQ